MSVLVFLDTSEGKVSKASIEAAFYAGAIASKAGSRATAVTYGNCPQDTLSALGKFGIAEVLQCTSLLVYDDQQATRLVVKAVEEVNANVVVTSFDPRGKALAPRLAARLRAGLVPAATSLPLEDGGSFVVRKNVFSGKAFAHVKITSDLKVISLLPNSIKPQEKEGTATIRAFNPEIGSAGLIVKEVKKASGELSLPEAELVVSAGRGLKGPDNWGMVEELAKTLGAATACSRPVSDIGWRPHHEHVGQTGIAIRPNLYIAIGISGAIQHLAGVNGSKVIVVINNDSEAPFFKAADYGVVGDAFEVVPRLHDALKKFQSQN